MHLINHALFIILSLHDFLTFNDYFVEEHFMALLNPSFVPINSSKILVVILPNFLTHKQVKNTCLAILQSL